MLQSLQFGWNPMLPSRIIHRCRRSNGWFWLHISLCICKLKFRLLIHLCLQRLRTNRKKNHTTSIYNHLHYHRERVRTSVDSLILCCENGITVYYMDDGSKLQLKLESGERERGFLFLFFVFAVGLTYADFIFAFYFF